MFHDRVDDSTLILAAHVVLKNGTTGGGGGGAEYFQPMFFFLCKESVISITLLASLTSFDEFWKKNWTSGV